MLNINKYDVKELASTVILSIMLIVCVLPGFNLIGNLFAQISVTVIINIAILLLFDLIIKIKPQNASVSLIIMTVFWVLTAIIKQIALHINTNNHDIKWLHMFYYDKPALIFSVMFITVLFYVIRLLSKRGDVVYLNSYRLFINRTIKCALVYYILILFYCFYLVREITFERTEPNLIPFEVIEFSLSRIDYELLFLLLGNIAIFFPLGVIVSSLSHNKALNLLLPVVLSISVEVSQYYLGNGHPDIDDVILNVSGYYLGIFVRVLLDNIVKKASGGKFKSFFIF